MTIKCKNMLRSSPHLCQLYRYLILVLLWLSIVWTQETRNGNDIHKIYVRKGENATLQCQSAKQINSLTWWKEANKIIEIENNRLVLGEPTAADNLATIVEDGFLSIRSATFNDSGHYRCIIKTNKDKALYFRLYVQDVPDPPGKPLIMGFSSRSANLSWAPSFETHHSQVLNYIIQTRVGENGEWDSYNGIETVDNKTSYQVTKLHPYTVYSFRVLAVSAIGTSQPGKESYYMFTLREVPEGKPTIEWARSTSNSTIEVEWRPPNTTTIHGELLGYTIKYSKSKNGSTSNKKERQITLRDPDLTSYTLKNLDTFTEYIINLSIFNPAGEGPSTAIIAMTDQGLSSSPQNLTLLQVTNNGVQIQWTQPTTLNGRLLGYRVYVHNFDTNLTEEKTLADSLQQIMNLSLDGLKPFTQYKVWVKAYNKKTVGQLSTAIDLRTDVAGPSAPTISKLTCDANNGVLHIYWERPTLFYNSIDYFFIHYRSLNEDNKEFEEERVPAVGVSPHYNLSANIRNLTNGKLYEIKLQAATRSITKQDKLYRGEFSESRKIIFPSCVCRQRSKSQLPTSIIVGLVCLPLIIILLIISLVLCQKYFRAKSFVLICDSDTKGGPPQQLLSLK